MVDSVRATALGTSPTNKKEIIMEIGILVFLGFMLIVGLVVASWKLNSHCIETYNYTPYNPLNWGIMLFCTLGFPFTGMFFAMLIGREAYIVVWILLFLTGTTFVMARNIKNTTPAIGIFSTFTLIPYSIVAVLLLVGVLDGLKKSFQR